MASVVATITAKLQADTAGFEKKMRSADKSMRGIEDTTKQTSGGLGKLAGAWKMVGATVAAGAVVKGLASAANAASDFGESVNAVEVATGDAAREILQLGEGAARSLGMSKTAVNEAAVAFSAFGEKIAASSGQDLGAVFEEYVTRAGDFASVMNLDVDDAMTKFQSGLAGETEALRRFGIDLSAASVKSYAMANGIGTAGQELSESEKVMARYGLLLQETDKFAGDFANTSGSMANQQKTLSAAVENAQIAIGEALVPAIEALLPLLIGLAEGAGHVAEAFGLGFKQLDVWIGGATLAEKQTMELEKIMGHLKDRLNDGRDAGLVAADAMGHLAKKGALTEETMRAVQEATGITDRTMQRALTAIYANADAYGLNADQAQTAASAAGDYGDAVAKAAIQAEEALAEQAREGAWAKTVEARQKASDDLAKQLAQEVKDFEQWEAEVTKANEDAERELSNSVEAIVSLFGGMPEKVEVSLDEMYDIIVAQREAATRFEANMRRLTSAGMDALVEELKVGTPEAIATAEALANDLTRAAEFEAVLGGVAVDQSQNEIILENLYRLGMTFAEALEAGWSIADLSIPVPGSAPGNRAKPKWTPLPGTSQLLMHSGGVVGGGVGTDEVLRVLQKGEGVIDRGTMQRGLSGGDTIIYMTVQGNVATEKDLAEAVRSRLLDVSRRNGSVGLS